MKTKFFALAALAATLFASCAKDNNGETAYNGDTKKVFLKIEQPSSLGRGVTDAVSDYRVEFASGYLYFVDAAGNITKYFTIGGGATDDSNLNLTALTSAQGISDIEVPASSSKVYVAANVPAAVTLPTAGMYSAVEAKIVTAASQVGSIVSTQAGTKFAINGVMLYSGGADAGTVAEQTAGQGDYEAVVTPRQIANRLEITDITAKAGGNVTGFTIDGIYVNNFYEQKAIGAAASPLKDYGSAAASYDAGQGLYTTAGVFYDAPALAATSLKAAPGTGKVWGYNLLAGSEVPHVIFKLSNITVADGYTAPTGGVGFITVKGFTDMSDGAIDFATGGQVFTVAADGLVFDLKDITPNPEMETIKAKVTVSLVEWVPVAVKPVI